MENKDNFKNLRNYVLGLKNQLLEMEIENKKDYIKKLDSIYKKIESPTFKIGFLSTFSTGKSTIINALLGKEILPMAEKSTTACITTISYGEENNVEIILNNASEAKNYLLDLNKKYKEIISLANKNNIYYRPKINFENLKEYLINNFLDISLNKKEELLKLIDDNNIKLFFEKVKEVKINNYLPIDFNNITVSCLTEKSTTSIDNLPFSNEKKEEIIKLKNEIILLEKILLKKNIAIQDIQEYREENFNCSLIKEIKIKLKNFNFKENIELIDLPGVNVSNDKHINITKEMADRVNAFVFIEAEMKAEGDLKRIAENVKEKFPNIYNYSYLLKNKMAYLQADEKNFNEKMLNFNILRKELGFKEENTFKVDALKYLNKEDLNKDYCIQFKNFQKKLEIDSEKLLIKEFIEMIKFETNFIYEKIIKKLNNSIGNISYFNTEDKNNSKEIYITEEINSQVENHKNYINISIEKLKDYKLLKISNESWKENNNNEILEEIKRTEKLDNYYLKKIEEGKDINKISFDKVFNILFSEYNLNEKIRKIYYNFITQLFYDNFKKFLKEIFKEENLKYLPEKQKVELEKIFNKEIKDRLSGAIDIILYSYESFREEAKEKLKLIYDCLISNKDNLNKYLEILNNNIQYFNYFSGKEELNKTDLERFYSITFNNKNEIDICKKLIIQEMKNYLENNIKKDINKYTKAIIKNYLEDIIIKLKETLEIKNYEAEYRVNIYSEFKKDLEEKFKKKKEEIEKKLEQKKYLTQLYENIL